VPVALYLQDAHSLRDAIDHVSYAERRGFDAVWQADSRLVRDCCVPMAAFAATTSTIKIGSGVVDCWTRNPARLAATFSTLDDLAPDRIILGSEMILFLRPGDTCPYAPGTNVKVTYQKHGPRLEVDSIAPAE